ncbi:MAG: DUF533 domain-containing protein [Trueperaceae bacterium]|nr:DUF533 domain-containing protein [Trueperaceae bacterium]
MSNVDTLKLLGSLLGNGALSKGSSAGVLQSVLGAVMGGGQAPQQSAGGLGGLMGAVLGGGNQSQQNSSLGGLMGAVLGSGNQAQQGSGLGGLLGSVLGSSQGQAALGGAGLAGLIGAAMQQAGHMGQAGIQQGQSHLPQEVNQADAHAQATLLIRAMVNAAKSDGKLDEVEQQAILGKLGEVTQDEIAFIKHELAQPLDVAGFIRSVPKGLEAQVYAMSLTAIHLDTQTEARYLDQLAKGFGMSPELCNQIHQQLGAPLLYG